MKELENKRYLPLSGAYNFRDLGGYRTRTGGQTKWRRIIRADSPHRLSKPDITALMDHGLNTVIDLRSINEVSKAPNPFAGQNQVEYLNIRLFDHLAPTSMQKDHADDIADPLLGFYIKTLANRQTAIRNVLEAIATSADGTVMFHCTAGKDRTGLIAALLLGMADVQDDDIISDYARTKHLIADLVHEFLELARNNGADLNSYRRLLDCQPDTMRNVVTHIRDCYTSVPEYLTAIGLDSDIKDRLKQRLTS